MTALEAVPEDTFEGGEDVNETLVEDLAVEAEDGDLKRLSVDDTAPDVVQEILVHEDAVQEEAESEYNETELDVYEQSSSEDEMCEDTTDDARRRGYLAVCTTREVIPVSSFVKSPNANKIKLPFHGLGDRSLEALLASLHGSTVKSIDLKENRISAAGIVAVSKSLCHLRHLVELDLSNNHLGAAGVQPVCSILQSCATLQRINLAGNQFGDKDAGLLAEAVGINTHLLHVILSRNAFGELGGLCFGAAIQNNRTLLTLDLSWNQIRRNGGMAVANGVRSNSTLTHLNLSWNAIGDLGALAMAEALKFNSSLLSLDMSNNTIGSEPCMAFAKALQVNSTLTTIRLGLNPLTNEGVLALIDSVKSNQNITTIDLSRVPVMQTVRDRIDDLLRPSPRLQAARLSNRRASMSLSVVEDQRDRVKSATDELAKARAAVSVAATPFARVLAKAKIESSLATLCTLLPSTASALQQYQTAFAATDNSFYRGGVAGVAARAAIVKYVAAGLGRSSSSEALDLARAAVRAELPEESDDAIEAVVRDAVYGAAAGEAATLVFREKLTSNGGNEALATKSAEIAFDAAFGPALAGARQAYSSYRAAHPKDGAGLLAAAREAYVRFGGAIEYDPIAEIQEEDATQVARDAMMKSLQISTRASEQEAGLENAAKVYRAAQGKREPTNAPFLQDVIDLYLAEKAINDAIAQAVEKVDGSYSSTRDVATSTATELEAAMEADVSEGRRPGLVFLVDEASGGHLKSKPEVDPFLLLEQYIERRNLRLVDIFLTFDNDRSGKITYDEFVKGIKAIGLDLKSSQITYLIEVADLDGDGTIDYQEFSALRQSTKMQAALEILQKRAALKKMQNTKEGKIAFGHLSVSNNLPGRTGGGLSIFHGSSTH